MNIKMKRMRTIVSILNAQHIQNQEQLTKALAQHGIAVTQATLSRDLHDLKAEKRIMKDGSIRYIIPANPVVEKHVLGIDSEIAKCSIKKIDFCGQFAVIRTRPGYANAVAYDIDDRGHECILGTIAGDDTILVIPKEGTPRETLFEFLYGLGE